MKSIRSNRSSLMLPSSSAESIVVKNGKSSGVLRNAQSFHRFHPLVGR